MSRSIRPERPTTVAYEIRWIAGLRSGTDVVEVPIGTLDLRPEIAKRERLPEADIRILSRHRILDQESRPPWSR